MMTHECSIVSDAHMDASVQQTARFTAGDEKLLVGDSRQRAEDEKECERQASKPYVPPHLLRHRKVKFNKSHLSLTVSTFPEYESCILDRS